MNNKNCCIGLCIFNNSQSLPIILNHLEKIADCFLVTHVIFYYDVSVDNTLDIVINFKTRVDNERMQRCINADRETQCIDVDENINKYMTVDIICNQNKRVVVGERTEIIRNAKLANGEQNICRTENIANARNGILNKIRKSYCNECDYFMMMDANNHACVDEIDIDVFKEVFEQELIEKWDAISFNREAGYYDYWALSFNDYNYSVFHFYNYGKIMKIMRDEFETILENHKKTNELINVSSAFNGFSVYKMKNFIDCEYSNVINFALFPHDTIKKQIEIVGEKIMNLSVGDCEHRSFHMQSIKKHGSQIRIYPKNLFVLKNAKNQK